MTLKARIRAIDRFVKGLKEDTIYNDLQAACVMAGWSNLAGALTPLKGAAPTASNITVYDRCTGAVFNGTSSTIDLNRAVSSDDKDDCHYSAYHASFGATKTSVILSHVNATTTGAISLVAYGDQDPPYLSGRFRSTVGAALYASSGAAGFVGASRSSADGATYRWNDDSEYLEVASVSSSLGNYRIGQYYSNYSSGDVAFYSAGSATDLSLLKARVSTLMADLRAIEEAGFDRDAIGYLRAVEEADGAFLETSVKVAVNNLVSGLKADGLWDAIGSSCLLCGPRTLAGALVPLRGDAPTPYGFVSGDHSRTNGLGDPGGTSYLDSNRSGVADARNDHHIAFYSTSAGGNTYPIGVRYGVAPTYYTIAGYDFYSRSASPGTTGSTVSVGTYGLSRDNGTSFNWIRASGSVSSASSVSQEVTGNDSYFVFAINTAGLPAGTTSGTLAFYSIGSSLDLAKLDSHITAYVTAIGAAL